MKYKIFNDLVFIAFDTPYNQAVKTTREMMNMPFEETAFIQSKAIHTIETEEAPTKEITTALVEEYSKGFKEILPQKNMHFVSLTFNRVEVIIE